jgi:hypothetical protein
LPAKEVLAWLARRHTEMLVSHRKVLDDVARVDKPKVGDFDVNYHAWNAEGCRGIRLRYRLRCRSRTWKRDHHRQSKKARTFPNAKTDWLQADCVDDTSDQYFHKELSKNPESIDTYGRFVGIARGRVEDRSETRRDETARV